MGGILKINKKIFKCIIGGLSNRFLKLKSLRRLRRQGLLHEHENITSACMARAEFNTLRAPRIIYKRDCNMIGLQLLRCCNAHL
jgi:hypothetical protein